MSNYWRRKNGKIPAFRDWESASELPITQYFENARQAGLIRYSSHHQYLRPHSDYKSKTKGKGAKKCQHVNKEENKSQGNVWDMTQPPPLLPTKQQQKQKHESSSVVSLLETAKKAPKPVDEDLYTISPQLLHSSKQRKKAQGFFSWVVPGCGS